MRDALRILGDVSAAPSGLFCIGNLLQGEAMKIQLARLYRGGRFYGFGIAVNGQLLDGLTSVVINTDTGGTPTATAVFNLNKDSAENQVVINLEDAAVRMGFDGQPSNKTVKAIKKAADEGAKRGYRNTVNKLTKQGQ